MALGITKQELANGRRLSVLPSNELLKWIVVRGRVWLRSAASEQERRCEMVRLMALGKTKQELAAAASL
jgi:hypothetical protein